MTVFVFGNPDVPGDSLPLRVLGEAWRRLPQCDFVVKDPNEDWDVPENIIILDTAVGINDVTVFRSLDRFVSAPRLSMHDFDALANIRYLMKLGKIKNITIIGVPPDMPEDQALTGIVKAISEVSNRVK